MTPEHLLVQVRVFIVGHQQLIRESLRLLLSAYPDIAVVGAGKPDSNRLPNIKALAPHVLLLDFDWTQGIDPGFVIQVRQQLPSVSLIALFSSLSAQQLRLLLHLDFQAFLHKDISGDELVTAICIASRGQTQQIVSSPLLKLLAQFAATDDLLPGHADLTEREEQALALIRTGLSNPEIAEIFQIKPQSMRNLAGGIYAKLGVHSRPELVALLQGQQASLPKLDQS